MFFLSNALSVTIAVCQHRLVFASKKDENVRTVLARLTRSPATTEEPRDALRQLKYYGRFSTELLTRALLMQRNYASTLSVEIV